MLYELLALSALIIPAAATPGLWSVHIEQGPAPSIDKVPPFSQNAIRDPAALKWQIPTLIGSYLVFVLLSISFVITFGRRLRLEALANTRGKSMELGKAPKRPSDPSPLRPPNTPIWRNQGVSRILGTSTSKPHLHAQKVVHANNSQQTKDMQRLYAAVLEKEDEDVSTDSFQGSHDVIEPPATSENWVVHDEQSTESASSHKRPKSGGGAWWIHPSQLDSATRHASQQVVACESSFNSALTPGTIRSAKSSNIQLPALPESPYLTQPPRTDSMPAQRFLTHSASRSSRNLRALRISTSTTPVLSATTDSAISRTTITPLSPLRSHPTSPVALDHGGTVEERTSSIRVVEQAEKTPKTALTYISENGVAVYSPRTETIKSPRLSLRDLNRDLPPLPLEAKRKDGRNASPLSPRKGIFGDKNTSTNPNQSSTSIAMTSSTSRPLPFRTLSQDPQGVPLPASPRLPPPVSRLALLQSPVNTRLTVLTPRREQFVRGSHPPVPATPYSAYMPFTPMTPVTPGLVRRAERRAMQREEPRRAATSDDLVPDDAEIWGDAYAE